MIPIDFDKPVDRIEDVLFDVELQKLIAVSPSSNLQNSTGKELPQYKLVCKRESGQIISIVSSNYRLIPNKDALKMGIDVFKQLFPSVEEKELIPFRIIALKTLASVNIDLMKCQNQFHIESTERKIKQVEKWLKNPVPADEAVRKQFAMHNRIDKIYGIQKKKN
jgi:hypothetical protein